MANKPDISYRNFPGEFNAINPADIPQGAAQTILNGVVRNQGVIEPTRGYFAPTYTPTVAPGVIGVIDSSRFITLATQDNVTGAQQGSAYVTGPTSNGVMYALDNLGNLNSTPLIRQWGWDLGIQPPSSSFNLGYFSAQRQGWIMTGRGLFKVERSSDNTSAPLSQVNLFPANLFPPAVTDYNNGVSLANGLGCFGVALAIGTLGIDASQAWLPPQYSVAYRFVTARKDPLTGQVRYSAPSDRSVTKNTNAIGGANMACQVFIYPPPDAPPDAFIQVYRSLAVPPGVSPSDEMYLVTEIKPKAPGVDGGFLRLTSWGFLPTYESNFASANGFAFNDITPGRVDDPVGSQIYVPLYTNSGLGNGAQAAKANAPVAQVSGQFGGRAYYLNTTTQQQSLMLLAGTTKSGVVSTTRGLTVGDTVTVDGVTFTAADPYNITALTPRPLFFCWNTTDMIAISPPTGLNVADCTLSAAVRLTSQSLVANVNRYFQYAASNGTLPQDKQVLANYISTGPGNEGQMLFRRPVPGSPPFTITTSSTNGWAQDYTSGLVSTSSTSVGSIVWSDLYQPDSCPIGNQVVLGSAGAACVGFVALRDFGIIFKEDGAWTVRETTRGPQFTPLDTTVHIVAPRAAVALGNECIALTAQGVVRIGEFGVENISQPIQREILGYLQRSQGLFSGAFAVGYEAEREYWLALPSSSTVQQADIVKIWNGKTNAWTTSKLGYLTAGAEIPTSSSTARIATTALALGTLSGVGVGSNPSYTGLLVESKSQTNNDYVMPNVTPPLTPVGNNGDGTFTLTMPPAWRYAVTVGSLLRCPAKTSQKTFVVQSTALAANQSTYSIAVDLINNTDTISAGDLVGAYIQPAIVTTIRFMPEDAGVPLLEKHWDGIYLWHHYWNGSFMSTGWETEKTPFPIFGTENGPGQSISTWGPKPWCQTVWLSPATDYVLSTSASPDYNRSGLLIPTFVYYNALSRFELSAVTFNIASVTDRIIIS